MPRLMGDSNIPEPGEYRVEAGSAWPDWFYALVSRYATRPMPLPDAPTTIILYTDGSYALRVMRRPQPS
jgi:hypothetical protein